MKISQISLDQVVDLRHKILRPHQTRQDCIYAGDDNPGAAHFGVFDDARLVGIASVYPEKETGEVSSTAWRLRGMAIDSDLRGKGVGRQLVGCFTDYIREQGGIYIWCNARTVAYGFYEKLGFIKIGDEFDIPGIGVHSVMKFIL